LRALYRPVSVDGVSNRHTLERDAHVRGVAVHAGVEVALTLRPAPPNTGIVFRRIDVTDRDNAVPALADRVADARLGASLMNGAGVGVATVEHLMAALIMAGVDDAFIDLDGPELPILDGSAEPYCRLVEQAGLTATGAPRRFLRMLRTIRVEQDDKWASLAPATQFEVDCTIDFSHPAIGVQRTRWTLDRDVFRRELAPARTFGFLREVEMLRAAGRARGASLDNVLVFDEDRLVTPGGFRWPDECARHKALDVVGDLALLGGPVLGRYEGYKPGHALNNALARAVLMQPDAWVWAGADADAEIQARTG
jgi:UDP-3-O-[3-hydroxymyristoyl] N-acetylglucosamine deacetylase